MKASETSTVTSAPTATLWSSIVPEASGAPFNPVTVTVNDCVAPRPPGSVAATVTVVVPRATPVTVTSLPETPTVATPVASDSAA